MLSEEQIRSAKEFIDAMEIDDEFVIASMAETIQDIIIAAVKLNNPGSVVFPTKDSQEVWEYMGKYAYETWVKGVRESSYDQGRADKTFEDMTKDI